MQNYYLENHVHKLNTASVSLFYGFEFSDTNSTPVKYVLLVLSSWFKVTNKDF